jgi:hypothetical protein
VVFKGEQEERALVSKGGSTPAMEKGREKWELSFAHVRDLAEGVVCIVSLTLEVMLSLPIL